MSQGVTSWEDSGFFPMQDHQDDVPTGMRKQMAGVRLQQMEDPSETEDIAETEHVIGTEDDMGTIGDIHPWLYWQTRDREERATGTWAMSYAGVCMDADGGTPTGRTGPPSKNSTFLPIRTSLHSADGRMKDKAPGWPKCFPRPAKGTEMLIIPAMEESSQQDIMLHTDPRLVAVNAVGSADCGTLVVDLQGQDEMCMDGATVPGTKGRAARLQSMMRVIALNKNSASPLGAAGYPGLAWNLTTSQQDQLLGYGMCYGKISGGGGSGPTTQSARQTVGSRISGDGAVQSGTGKGLHEDDGKEPKDFGKFGANPQRGHGIGFMANEGASGPFVIGAGFEDKHTMGADADGHPMTSGHISTNAYFYGDKHYDAPMAFEFAEYPKVKELPIKVKVHLQYKSGSQHSWVKGSRAGIWDWWSTSNVSKPSNRQPKTPGGGKGGTTGGPGGPRTPGPITPGPGGPGTPGPGPGVPGPGGPKTPGPGKPGGPITPGGGPGGPTTGGPGKPKDPRTPGPITPGGGKDPKGPITHGGVRNPSVPAPRGGSYGWNPKKTTAGPRGVGAPPSSGGGGGIPLGGGDDEGGGGPVPGGNSGHGSGNVRNHHETGSAGVGDSDGSSGYYDGAGGFDQDSWMWRFGEWRPGITPGFNSSDDGGGFDGNTTDPDIIGGVSETGSGDGQDSDGDWDPIPAGVVNKVGYANGEIGLMQLYHPMMEGFSAMSWRAPMMVLDGQSLVNDDEFTNDDVDAIETYSPSVLGAHAFGGTKLDGSAEFDYNQEPEQSRARGGTADGGIMFTPPHLMPEDYFGFNSDLDVGLSAIQTTATILATPGTRFGLGTPKVDGSLNDNAIIVEQDSAGSLDISQMVSGTKTSIMTVLVNGAEEMVRFAGTHSVTIPAGVTGDRPSSSSDGEIRVNTTSFGFEFFANEGWNQVANQVDLSSHTTDSTIHFTEAGITHGNIGGLSADDHTIYLKVDGLRAMTGNLLMGNNEITGLKAGLAAGNAVELVQAVGAFVAIGGSTMTGALIMAANIELNDNRATIFGTGGDADILYDGTDLVVDPSVAGTGKMLFKDNKKIAFGTGKDAEIYYDGVDLNIDPDVVGSGKVDVLGTINATAYQAGGTAGMDSSGTFQFLTDEGMKTHDVTVKNGIVTEWTVTG